MARVAGVRDHRVASVAGFAAEERVTKPSREPVPDVPRIRWTGPSPRESRLWAELDRGNPLCPWCAGFAQRVIKTPSGPSHSCWDDHV